MDGKNIITQPANSLNCVRSEKSRQFTRVELAFDDATNFLLWQRNGKSRLKRLHSMLQKNDSLLPADYGIEKQGTEFVTFPEEGWPLEVRYSADRILSLGDFEAGWYSYAEYTAQNGESRYLCESNCLKTKPA